jgi:hypothetical protein
MAKLSNYQKLAYFRARKRSSDSETVAWNTGYSRSHICNVIAGRRSLNTTIADSLYETAKGRKTV